MKKTKILHVWSGDEYAALTFEQSPESDNLSSIWEKAYKAKDNTVTLMIKNCDEVEDEIDVRAYLFKDIDPKFIDFLHDRFIDYDDSKHENFYVIKETPCK